MLLRILTAVVTIALASASPLSLINEALPAAEQPSAQTPLNICPELSVRCVADGDWRNPIGTLGKRRMSSLYVFAYGD
jgi:hypothetical protein